MNTVHPLLSAIIDEFEASADHLTFRGYQRREACTNWRIAGKPVLAEPAEAHASYNDVDTLRRQAVEMADEIDAKNRKIKELERRRDPTGLHAHPEEYIAELKEKIQQLERSYKFLKYTAVEKNKADVSLIWQLKEQFAREASRKVSSDDIRNAALDEAADYITTLITPADNIHSYRSLMDARVGIRSLKS